MSWLEDIEAEVGPLNEAEREDAEREIKLLARLAKGLVGRVPTDANREERQAAITELLHEDPELFAAFSQLMDVSRSSRASPLQSLARVRQTLAELDESEP